MALGDEPRARADEPPSPATAIRFEKARLASFRNIEAAVLTPSARLNLISGDNGQGKTSILEALYAVATTRSFRTDKLAQVVKTGAEQARVSATVREGRTHRVWPPEVLRKFQTAEIVTEHQTQHYVLRDRSISPVAR